VEVHTLPVIAGHRFALVCEGFPIWLLGLEPSWITSVTLVGFGSLADWLESLSSRSFPTQLVERAYSRINPMKVHFVSSSESIPNDVDVFLLSGSLPYLLEQFQYFKCIQVPTIGTIDSHVSSRFNHGRPKGVDRSTAPDLAWFRIRHETVGGMTLFNAVHATRHTGCVLPQVTTLRRKIASIMDASVKPRFLTSREKPDHALSAQELLSPLHLEQPVMCSTRFYSSGWGIRSLTTGELASAFGFSVRLRMGEISKLSFNVCVPIQLLHSILLPVLTSTGPTIGCKRHKIQWDPIREPRLIGTGSVLDTDGALAKRSWLPSIQRWLSHQWIDPELVTATAAKRDDACVPTSLWDARLTLLYPGVTRLHLETLRSWLLRRCRLNVTRSLLRFLRSQHSIGWALQLTKSRASRHQGGVLFPKMSAAVST
jgi:hypothetical protein